MENKLPEGWMLVELKDYAYFQEGPGIRKWQFTDKGIKLLNVKNLVDGELDLSNTNRYVSEEEVFEKYKHFLLNPDEIVMASSGVTWGKTAIVRSEHLPLILNTSTIRFRSLDCKILDQNYLLNFLNSELFKKQIERLITGSAQPNFGPSHLIQVKLFLPPLETQQKIVAILEKAEETKKLRAQADELTQQLLQSVFLEMFGSSMDSNEVVVKKLGSLIEKDSSISYGIVQPGDEFSNGISTIRPVDIINNQLVYEDIKKIDPEIEKKYGRTRLKGNEILVTVRGTTGNTAITDQKCEGFNVTRGIAVIRPDEKLVNKLYLNEFLKSPLGNRFIQENTKGATLRQINMNDLKIMPIVLPPIKTQEKFVELIQTMEKTKQTQKQSSLEINNLFDALMQKAFTGELVS